MRLAVHLLQANESSRHRGSRGVAQRGADLDPGRGVARRVRLVGDEDQLLRHPAANLEARARQERPARDLERRLARARAAGAHLEAEPTAGLVHHHRREQEACRRLVGRNGHVEELDARRAGLGVLDHELHRVLARDHAEGAVEGDPARLVLGVGAAGIEPRELREVVVDDTIHGYRVAVDLERRRLPGLPPQVAARDLHHDAERLSRPRVGERQAEGGEREVARAGARHHELGRLELPLQRRLGRPRQPLEVTGAMREPCALASYLHLQLVECPWALPRLRLIAEDVVAARHVQDLAQCRAEIVRVLEEPAPGLAGEEVQRFAAARLTGQVLVHSAAGEAPVRPQPRHVDGVDDAVGAGELADHGIQRPPQSGVAIARGVIDVLKPSLGDRDGRRAGVGGREAHERLGVEAGREVQHLLAPFHTAESLCQLLQAPDEHHHLAPIHVLVRCPHHAQDGRADLIGDRAGGLAEAAGGVGLDVGAHDVGREAQGIIDAREARHSEGAHRMEEQQPVLGEVGHDPDAAVDVEGRHRGEVRRRQPAAQEIRRRLPSAVQTAGLGERHVEEKKEMAARGRRELEDLRLVGLGGVDVLERHDARRLSVLGQLEVVAGEAAHRASVFVDDEHGHRDEGDFGAEDGGLARSRRLPRDGDGGRKGENGGERRAEEPHGTTQSKHSRASL